MRGVIFDLDGTLADTLRDIAAAMEHVLRERGLPGHDEAAYARFVGEGARMLVQRALGDRIDREDEVLEAFRARYFAHLLGRTRPFPGVEALLAELARRGVPTAVLSNKPHEATEEVVRALFPDHPFLRIVGDRPDYPRKPDPTSALEIAEALHLAPASILFVGDTQTDVGTALAAGMIPIGVRWGMRPAEELKEAGATHLIGEPDELLALL